MIYKQSVFERWPIEDESCQLIATSPPYYALRKYSIPDIIIGGDKDCKHVWGNKNITLKHKSGEINEDIRDAFCFENTCEISREKYKLFMKEVKK